MPRNFHLGQFLLVSIGRGKVVARVERVTPKRVYYRRLLGLGTPAVGWSLYQTKTPIETLRIWSEPTTYTPGKGRPRPPLLADFNHAIGAAEETLRKRREELKSTAKESVLYRHAERAARGAHNALITLRHERDQFVRFLGALDAARAA